MEALGFSFLKNNFLKKNGSTSSRRLWSRLCDAEIPLTLPNTWDSVADMTGLFAIIKAPLGGVGESVVSEEMGLVSGGIGRVMRSSWHTM